MASAAFHEVTEFLHEYALRKEREGYARQAQRAREAIATLEICRSEAIDPHLPTRES